MADTDKQPQSSDLKEQKLAAPTSPQFVFHHLQKKRKKRNLPENP